jgi:hypothetical protein
VTALQKFPLPADRREFPRGTTKLDLIYDVTFSVLRGSPTVTRDNEHTARQLAKAVAS